MANPYRGEIALELDGHPDGHLNGETRTLRLSLTSLARLEQALNAADLSTLIKQLVSGQTSASQISLVLREALQAGDGVSAKDAEILLSKAAPMTLARTYVDLMRATFADQNGQ